MKLDSPLKCVGGQKGMKVDGPQYCVGNLKMVKVSGLLGKWTVHKIKQKGPKTWAGGQKGMKVDGLRMRGQSQRDESGRPAKVR